LAQGDLDRQHLQPVPVLLACLLEPTLIIVRRTAVISGFVVVPHRWVVARALGPMTATAQGPRATPEVLAVIVTLAVIGIMLHRFVHQNRKRLPPPGMLKRPVGNGLP
jgi:ABC-type nitrate/sulfonate/bicarbonate transport system permease component